MFSYKVAVGRRQNLNLAHFQKADPKDSPEHGQHAFQAPELTPFPTHI